MRAILRPHEREFSHMYSTMTIAPLYTSNAQASVSAAGPVKSFPPKEIETIGDALAATAGFAQNGTLVSALQPQSGSSLTQANPNSSLAAQLNPAVNLKLNASLQVADFVSSSTTTTSIASSTTGSDITTAETQSLSGTSAYNTVSSASTSTIRGSSINAIA
ncbi:MAG: hypothetical protein WAO98_03235 [Alphaproteobacteria bacterium]